MWLIPDMNSELFFQMQMVLCSAANLLAVEKMHWLVAIIVDEVGILWSFTLPYILLLRVNWCVSGCILSKLVLAWYRLLNIPAWSWYWVFKRKSNQQSWHWVLKKVSLEPSPGFDFGSKTDFWLVWCRYVPGIEVGISQVYIWHSKGWGHLIL